MKTITLSLDRALIIEAVKDDTFITGQIDKSNDAVKNASRAFNEQAGDEEHHQRKMLRTLRTAVSAFEANMMEFIDSANGSIDDTLANTSDANTTFVITVSVSDRYNSGQAKPLASLAYEYIINQMLYQWWQSIDSTLAKDYLSFALNSLQHIRLCLAKTAPAASAADYTDITGTVSGAGIASIAFPRSIYAATMGQSFNSPQPTTIPSGLLLTFSSNDTSVATVDSSTGQVTLVGAGNAVITASFGGNNQYEAAAGSYRLNVNPE